MQKTQISVFISIVIILGLIFFRFGQTSKSSTAFFVMDTFFEITSSDKKVNSALTADVKNLINKIDLAINAYNPQSEISLINKNAGIKETVVTQETYSILTLAYHYSQISEGLFDITFCPLQDLYGFENGDYKIPSMSEIELAKQKVDYKKIVFNEMNKSIFLKDPRMKINVSGIMKGYVLDRVKDLFTQKGIKSYFLNFGGNLYIHSTQKEKIGIKHPRKKSIIYSFPLSDGFVSTSADDQQYFEKNNQRYCHIINPLTGSAQQKMQSVTVVAGSGIESDFLSTTLFLMEPGDIDPWITKYKQNIGYFAYDGTREYKNQWEKTP